PSSSTVPASSGATVSPSGKPRSDLPLPPPPTLGGSSASPLPIPPPPSPVGSAPSGSGTAAFAPPPPPSVATEGGNRCARCSFVNPAGFKFCGSCGQPLGAAPVPSNAPSQSPAEAGVAPTLASPVSDRAPSGPSPAPAANFPAPADRPPSGPSPAPAANFPAPAGDRPPSGPSPAPAAHRPTPAGHRPPSRPAAAPAATP